MAEFIIAHIYPDLMNLYSDRGNLLCLKKRLEWYGQQCSVKNIARGDKLDYSSVDMVFIGSGSLREQRMVCHDLISRSERLIAAVEKGLPVLCICGAYQLLGKSYIDSAGKIMYGAGLFDFVTREEKGRLTGNIVVVTTINGESQTVVGFENHRGRTYYQDPALKPFATVIKGYGNNGKDKQEGFHYKNLIGTYLHGPLLPKNPAVADYFITAMAERKGLAIKTGLEDSVENFAREQVIQKILS